MFISTALASATIMHINNIVSSAQDLRVAASLLDHRWEDLINGDLSPQDAANVIVDAANGIQEEVAILSRLYPAEELQPDFRRVSDEAEGAKQLVTLISLK